MKTKDQTLLENAYLNINLKRVDEEMFQSLADYYAAYRIIVDFGIPVAIVATLAAVIGISAVKNLAKKGKDAVFKVYDAVKGEASTEEVESEINKIEQSKSSKEVNQD